jgi:uncharacterized membrane protein YphA (DoxX/SURF4 family)
MENKLGQDNLVLISFFLRAGLAIVFLYAGISSLIEPSSWIGYVPQFINIIIPREMFLSIYSIFEIILALWLLSNKKIYYASLLSSLTLLLIIFPNIFQLEIVFRDIAIFFSGVSLAVLSYEK